MKRSLPASPNYGRHWAADEVSEFFAASKQGIDVVKRWLVDSGIAGKNDIEPSQSRNLLDVNTTVSKIQKAHNTEYYIYNHPHHEGDHIGAESYSMPQHVADHVDVIVPGVTFAGLSGATLKPASRSKNISKAKKANNSTCKFSKSLKSLIKSLLA